MTLRRITANLWWKLASLAIATGLWFTLIGEPELTTTIAVPVQYKKTQPGIDVSSEAPHMVQLEIRGPSSRLGAISPNRTPIILDLSGESEPGQKTFTITQQNVQLPAGVVLARAIPSQLRLTLERRIAREVPVQVRFTGPPPIGFRIASVGAFPDRVFVTGPESHAQRVQYVETDPIQLSGIPGVASFTVQVYVPDQQVSLDEPAPVIVRVDVEKIPPGLLPKK